MSHFIHLAKWLEVDVYLETVFICALGMIGPQEGRAMSEVKSFRDAESGFDLHEARVKNTKVKLCPNAGFNLFSIEHDGIQFLKEPSKLKELPGFMYGVPVIYPMPNRVKNSEFVFQGKSYKFTPNNDEHFLHGLAHDVAWNAEVPEANNDQCVFKGSLAFEPGSKRYDLFPFAHVLNLKITIRSGSVRWDYEVDNAKGTGPVPIGMCLHPWFLYQGERKQTFLKVPATHVMEAEKLIPTGKLVDLAGSKFDARNPISLENFVIDDVYFGMTPEQPAEIYFRDKKIKVVLKASEDFTHLVVYTPAEKPWFCVENQSCSTDAHNLHQRGLTKESHLLVVEPGKKHTGWIEYSFEVAK